jgi:hypothetical protein
VLCLFIQFYKWCCLYNANFWASEDFVTQNNRDLVVTYPFLAHPTSNLATDEEFISLWKNFLMSSNIDRKLEFIELASSKVLL